MSRRPGTPLRPPRCVGPSGPCVLFLALVFSLFLTVACTPTSEEEAVEFRVPVFVQDVETGAVEDTVVATGTLRAPEMVVLRADTGGSLAVAHGADGRRLFEGERVDAGQTIAEVTGEEVRLAARTEATRQRYETAKHDFESKQRLYEQGLISEQEFRPVQDALAEARLELERSQLTETRSRLVTPIAGVILRLARDSDGLPVADGQLVEAGFVVAQIAPTRSLIADVDILGADVGRVREGMPARVRQSAWNDRTFEGRLSRLAPSLSAETRTLRAEVVLDNPDELLRPGMFVEVTMVAARHEGVPLVPRDAVTERGGRKVVFVVKGQRVSRRDVVLGLGDDNVVEIEQGLEPGERIVVRGLETLTDGQRVRVTGT